MRSGRAEKIRADRLVVERGLAESREKAQALILAGQIFADNQKVEKCGALIDDGAELRLRGEKLKYVSRGGVKLAGALDHFGVSPAGKICLDVGASTGGFTDCLLERGASRVIAVDVGTNQLDWKLRRDPRVTVFEKTNARYLQPKQIISKCAIATMDVSFISATRILPVLPALLESGAEVLVLAKPQFEVGRGQVGKGGIVRDAMLQAEAVAKVAAKLRALGFSRIESVESCLPGAEGNREFFLHAFWLKPA
ncbi:MAG: TlyA family RNA methyltransferase [Acidobacteria bacterium]|nr:TlyA family RNA methyltransferase [Acidobacteriota bacterium]